ncbi:hypothetical protein D3C73_938350 [compost metagenome]
MRNEQHRRPGFRLHGEQQLQHLRLHGDVQRRRRFVGDDQFGRERAGDGNHDALAHATRQFVRICVCALRRVADANTVHQCHRAVPGLLAADTRFVDAQHFGNLVGHAAAGVQRRHGFLEHHGDVLAAQRVHVGIGGAQQVVAVKPKFVRRDAARRVDQPHQGKARNGFSGAGLAHQADDFAAPYGQVHSPDRGDHTLGRIEVDAQVANRQQGFFGISVHRCSSGFSTSCSQSPSTLTASTVKNSASAGTITGQGLVYR